MISVGALPGSSQYLADHRGALQKVLRIRALEIDGKFQLDRAEKMRRRAIKMRRQHVDQGFGAVIPTGLGNRVHQPTVRGPHPDTDAAHLDMFVGKSQKLAITRGNSDHLVPLHLALHTHGGTRTRVGLNPGRDLAIHSHGAG